MKLIHKIADMRGGKVLVKMPRKVFENLSILTLPAEDLGAAILSYRIENKLSQGDLGKMLGGHRNWVVNLERGLCRPERISICSLKKIMAVILK